MEIKSDFLVIGSGIAGLFFALKVCKYGSVVIVTKRDSEESSTKYAQGGIASVMAEDDSYDLHIKDTLEAGAGLCNEDAVKLVVENGPEKIRELIELGAKFTLQGDKADVLALGREGGHSKRRIVHAADFTGAEIERALIEAVKKSENIRVYENHIAIDLITKGKVKPEGLSYTGSDDDRVYGAYVLNKNKGEVNSFLSKITIIATGGAGKVYLYTSNPDISTGDGIAMAYRAGARIANMEFIQFHPTCLYHPDAKSFLITEAVRGEGGLLKLKDGSTFMEKYHPMGCLAPRDIVARAIDYEMKKSGDDCVYLDVTHLEGYQIRERFPTIYKICLSLGIDITKTPIPVVPAAHYTCGGIVTDFYGRTNMRGLYAAGETACTGVHGANRLASNSLLEALVFSHKAAERAIQESKDTRFEDIQVPQWDTGNAVDSDESVVVSNNWDEIRRTLWNYVGIVRSNKRLNRAKRRIDILLDEIKEYYWNFIITSDLIELRNIATVADLIIQCAMMRKESRGLHYNIDYPSRDDVNWRKDTV
ncbi:MAG: L-aspartate oxidase, partial [Nitrospinae bacterium]|nr:L-aspartate oxidase [Nitrospinota bacterium]